jgi:hypothetical protein
MANALRFLLFGIAVRLIPFAIGAPLFLLGPFQG